MTEVFLERRLNPPLTASDVIAMGASADCFALHRVGWQGSCLAVDGTRLLCHFHGPDAESVRVALRQAGVDPRICWPGTICERPASAAPLIAPPTANVLVERSFREPVQLAAIQEREDAHAWCLEARHVTFVRTFFSLDRLRMICFYQAPDAESVRVAQRQAGLPLDSVWSFNAISAPASE